VTDAPLPEPTSIDEMEGLLSAQRYIAGRDLSTVAFLALRLGKPLFLEGEPGTGKTEIAKALAQALGRKLIRLQCYEGLDASSAIAEWNFPAQMIAIRTAEAAGNVDRAALQSSLFTEDYLIRRPLLEALSPQPGGAPVLLIDEIDRADAPFEAFLLEALSEAQVTIPELGTIRAAEPPIVILTSNRTREVHDALKRRCLYHWVGYPSFQREVEILRARVPEAGDQLSAEIVAFVQGLRMEDLFKSPGVAESIDWARALLALDALALSPEIVTDTLGAVLKYQDDIARVAGSEAARILDDARARLARAHEHAHGGPAPIGRLAENILHFARALRKAGVKVGPVQVAAATQAVALAGFSRKDDFYHILRACLITRADHLDVYHQVFMLFWRDPGLSGAHDPYDEPAVCAARRGRRKSPAPPSAAQPRRWQTCRPQTRSAATQARELVETDARFSFSVSEVLRQQDFEQMSIKERAEAEAALRALHLPLPRLPGRRARASPQRRARRSARHIAPRHAPGRRGGAHPQTPCPARAALIWWFYVRYLGLHDRL
jgi:MoxR-like ATPase